ncbi:hypothetical protein V6N12_062026 [Hibiscus sabdariffa]|uniref:F-box associated beta-propeller type 1 domain-containing protein n=1 Tax=Hibiscus sabdariffa TaxID=183260 RepID=A0ABR2DZ55_9ROSI
MMPVVVSRLTGRAVVQLTIEKGDDEVGGEPRKMTFRYVKPDIVLVNGVVISHFADGTKLSCINQAIISKNDTGKNGYSVLLEIMPSGQFEPLYKTTLSALHRELSVLPLSVYGVVSMAHSDVFEEYSSPYQIFFCLYDKRNVKISNVVYLNVGFGFDPRTNDYKLLIVVVCKCGGSIEPYLLSLNGNCWKKVTANSPNSFFGSKDMTFVNGVVHWLGFRGRKKFGYNYVILGFDMTAEGFFEMKLPESLFGFCHDDLSIMKYGESSIVVTTHSTTVELHELWIMKEYGVVHSWAKLLTLHRIDCYAWIPRVLGFRKNGEVLLRVDDEKIASLDLNYQQMEAPLYFKCQQMELYGVEVRGDLQSVNSYVESLELLDKAVNVRSDSA